MTVTHDFDENEAFANYTKELSERPQPKACEIDNPECENCGS